jgi:PKD repeat protein
MFWEEYVMVDSIKRLFDRCRTVLITGFVVFGIGAAGAVIASAQNQSVSATTCDKVNIIYCGLSGSNTSGYISSFQNYYNSNKSGHSASPTVKKDYTDVQKVFNYFNASSSIVKGMNTTNTKIGTLYRDGHIVVDGKTVATDAIVAARFSVPGAVSIPGTNVYIRRTTSSFAQDKASVIVYFKDGKIVFGAMVNCGNPISGKPVETPKPKPQTLVCSVLTPQKTAIKDQYIFTAKATSTNGATISGYTFVYGDGQQSTVKSSATQVTTAPHTYTKPGTYNATATITGTVDGKTYTTPVGNCKTTITITAPAQALVCSSLVHKATTTKDQYEFTAKATPTNGATISGYTFKYGDTKTDTVNTTAQSATTTHTYTAPGTYEVTVTVTGKVNGASYTTPVGNCKTTVTIDARPDQVLECTLLSASETKISVGDKVDFTAKASARNGATISGYEFNYGDTNSVDTVLTNNESVTKSHIYSTAGTYTAIVNVTGKVNGSNAKVSSGKCRTIVTVDKLPEQIVVCIDLQKAATSNKDEYTFTARANTIEGATISSYVFNFGDDKSQTIQTSEKTATTTHAYTKPGNYFAKVSVTGTANGKQVTVTSQDCVKQIPVAVPPTPECKPGIPVGDVRCNPCTYNPSIPADSPQCKAPVVMPATGAAGIFTLFGATSALGAIGHRIFLKRHLR